MAQALFPAPGDSHMVAGARSRVSLVLRGRVVSTVGGLVLAVLLNLLILAAVLPVVLAVPGFLVDPLVSNEAVL